MCWHPGLEVSNSPHNIGKIQAYCTWSRTTKHNSNIHDMWDLGFQPSKSTLFLPWSFIKAFSVLCRIVFSVHHHMHWPYMLQLWRNRPRAKRSLSAWQGEESEGFMCGNCSWRESAAGNFCLERNRLEVCGEIRQETERREAKRRRQRGRRGCERREEV